MPDRVIVVGGGYGGVNVAKAVDEVAEVVLVEPRDAFVHNVAALRATVDPDWGARIFLPYDRLLDNGRVVRDRARLVEPGRVTLSSSEVIEAAYVVLATGSRYPFPAKTHHDDAAASLKAYAALHSNLMLANRILLVGAGPVGIELAGEITSRWPDKQVTLVDLADEILTGDYDAELRNELLGQLKQRGVEVLLGSPLTAVPETPVGVLAPFTATTASGEHVDADLWLACHGVEPITDYLSTELAEHRNHIGQLAVDPYLRVEGFDHVFAVGDITAVREPKMAGRATRHADVVAANVRSLLNGEPASMQYTPMPPVIVVPLGPTGGAAQLPDSPTIAGPDIASQYKGHDLLVDRYRELLRLPAQ